MSSAAPAGGGCLRSSDARYFPNNHHAKAKTATIRSNLPKATRPFSPRPRRAAKIGPPPGANPLGPGLDFSVMRFVSARRQPVGLKSPTGSQTQDRFTMHDKPTQNGRILNIVGNYMPSTGTLAAPAAQISIQGYMVGVTGFEPATPASRTQYSTRLSYTPIQASNHKQATARKKHAAKPRVCPLAQFHRRPVLHREFVGTRSGKLQLVISRYRKVRQL